VVPYIGDLVGVTDLPPDLSPGGGGVSRRAFVANTVAYRRRKGTVAVLEQLARDVTDWPARAVEYYRHLAVITHVNHVRLDRPATAAVRTPPPAAGPLELVPPESAMGALDPVAHTVEVRRVASGRGRYGIGAVGVFLFPDQAYETGWVAARSPDGGPGNGWSVDPLGFPTPLYGRPMDESVIEHLATEADLPVPLRPRRLLALLTAAREGGTGEGLPLAVRVAGAGDLPPERLRVCGLEDLAPDPAPLDPAHPRALPGWQVFVDAVSGRLHPYLDGAPAVPDGVQVSCCYGGTADVGAGTYDRARVHAEVLASDPYVGDPAGGGPAVRAQAAVRHEQGGSRALAAALADAQAAWARPGPPAGATYVVVVGDSGAYDGDLAIHVPESTRLVVVAATWELRVLPSGALQAPPVGVYAPVGLRPLVRGTLTITGGGGSSVVLDGLVVEGDVVVGPGSLGSLAVSQCTISGALRVGVGPQATNPGLAVQVVRSVVGGAMFGPAAASLALTDSVVDAPGADAVSGRGLALQVGASTVRGAVRARTLQATSAILDGEVLIEHRQTGCVRYSFVHLASRVPRRYRCVPVSGGDPQVRPVYASVEAGSPRRLALAPTCPASIAEGGEGGAEMGVHHHLGRPLRVRAASRLLAPYLPVGLELGVMAPVSTARS
jgi:hypothetical protein